jgi:hypothetical protein
LQIFQVQDQRRFCADHFERLGHLAQHSLLRRHLRESLQPSAILRVNETRHLRQPRWGNSMQNLNQFLAAGLASESRQGFENRQVRLARAVLVDALPSPDTNCSVACERIGERMRQHRLTDPWLTRHEDHSSRAAPGLLEPIVKLRQFCRASNHFGGSGLYLPVGHTRPGCQLEPRAQPPNRTTLGPQWSRGPRLVLAELPLGEDRRDGEREQRTQAPIAVSPEIIGKLREGRCWLLPEPAI